MPVVIRGTTQKPVAADLLATYLLEEHVDGELFVGFPVLASAEGPQTVDALLVSREHGVVAFDLVEGPEIGPYTQRQDEAVTTLQARLLLHRDLKRARQLAVPVDALTFAPGAPPPDNRDDTLGWDSATLVAALNRIETRAGQTEGWSDPALQLYEHTLSALQSISALRRSQHPRRVTNPESRGARLQSLEGSIATLDQIQGRAVIETVEGVQRIRGLAGSGKTIVLALKAAYLHGQHPDWRIAVTFNTRSLRQYFIRLITRFCLEQTGDEPDWEHLRVMAAWGGRGSSTRDGLYREYTIEAGAEYLNFAAARETAPPTIEPFQFACSQALLAPRPEPRYDTILIDEAQDLPPEFLRLCFNFLREPRRLVYAYDELQNLTRAGLPPPEEIFGEDDEGQPLVSLRNLGDPRQPRRDIILEKCYRNSRPVLTTAHSLGFGIYRKPPKGRQTGLVQMFDNTLLWEEIGYSVEGGELTAGQKVVLARTAETSPAFLEEHSPREDLVRFCVFESAQGQAEWIAEAIERNLRIDELRYDDIIVVAPDALTARRKLGLIRKALFERDIQGHIAGVETDSDVFFQDDVDSITFTGIHRAKGNEAAMVYVVHGEDCFDGLENLARLRNKLFTAITRSKAWVRVCGVGPGMEGLRREYEQLAAHDFQLAFRYPTPEERAELDIVHRDMSPNEARALRRKRQVLNEIVRELDSGAIRPEDLGEELRSLLEVAEVERQETGDES